MHACACSVCVSVCLYMPCTVYAHVTCTRFIRLNFNAVKDLTVNRVCSDTKFSLLPTHSSKMNCKITKTTTAAMAIQSGLELFSAVNETQITILQEDNNDDDDLNWSVCAVETSYYRIHKVIATTTLPTSPPPLSKNTHSQHTHTR